MKFEIPLYKKLINGIIRYIKEEQLSAGEKLPTEKELIERYSVSRATVIRAMNELENMNIIERIQGKGTFVAGQKFHYSLPKLTGFSEDIRSSLGTPKSVLIDYKISKEFKEAEYFSQNDKELLFIGRLRLSENEPIGINYNYIPLKIARTIGFLPEEINDNPEISLYHLLEENGYNLSYADQVFEAKAASKSEAKLLNLKQGSPIMYYERITRTDDNRVVEFVRASIAGHSYKYSIRLYRNKIYENDSGVNLHN